MALVNFQDDHNFHFTLSFHLNVAIFIIVKQPHLLVSNYMLLE